MKKKITFYRLMRDVRKNESYRVDSAGYSTGYPETVIAKYGDLWYVYNTYSGFVILSSGYKTRVEALANLIKTRSTSEIVASITSDDAGKRRIVYERFHIKSIFTYPEKEVTPNE